MKEFLRSHGTESQRELKRAFQEGLDIHAMTASEMFGVPIEGRGGTTSAMASIEEGRG